MTIGKRYKFQGTSVAVEVSRATAKIITGITKANPAVATSTAHGYPAGSVIYVNAVDSMPDLAAGEYVVGGVSLGYTANTLPLVGVDSTNFAAFAVDSPNTNTVQLVTFSNFCELTGYNQQDGASSDIDATTVCSTSKEFEVGLPDSGTVSLDYNAAPGTTVQTALRNARKLGSVIAVQLVFPKNGGSVIMFGIVKSTTLAGSNDALHKATAQLKLTGDIVILSSTGAVL